jgi:fatty acid-binding protein DegV
MAGAVLSIKPVIAIENGEVVVLGKARGSKNGNNMLKEMIQKEGDVNFALPSALAYSGLSDALLRKYIADSKDMFGVSIEVPPITTIGSAIGTHIGPGAIAAAFFVV